MEQSRKPMEETVVTGSGVILPTSEPVCIHCAPFDSQSTAKTEVFNVAATTTVRELKQLLVSRINRPNTTVTLFSTSTHEEAATYSALTDDIPVTAIVESEKVEAGQTLTLLYMPESAYGCWWCCPCCVGMCLGACCAAAAD